MKNQIDQSTPFLAFYDLLRIRGIYSTEEKREKLRRGFRRAMALAAVFVGVFAAALPSWALPGGLAGDSRVSTSGTTMTISPNLGANAGSDFSWDSFNVAGNETVTIDATSIHTAPSFDVAGLVDAGSNVLVFKTPGGNIAVSGEVKAGRFFAATFDGFNKDDMHFAASAVQNGDINITGTIPSDSVLVGNTISASGAAATAVATAGMLGTSDITIASGGGTITFVGTTGAGSVLKAGTVNMGGSTVAGDDTTSVSATGEITGDFSQSAGSVEASTLTGKLTQSGGVAAISGTIASLEQTTTAIAGTSATAANITTLVQNGANASATATTAFGSVEQTAGSATGSVTGDATIGGTLIAAAVGGKATVSGTLNGVSGSGLSVGSLEQTGGTIAANGTLTIGNGGESSQTGGTITASGTSLNAGTQNVSLNQAGNSLGTISGTAGNATLNGSSLAVGNLTLSSGSGKLTLQSNATLSGNVSASEIDAGATTVSQTAGTVDFGNAGTLKAGKFDQSGSAGIHATTLAFGGTDGDFELRGTGNNVRTLTGSSQTFSVNNGGNNITLKSLSASGDIVVRNADDVTLDGFSGGVARIRNTTGEVNDTANQGAVLLELGQADLSQSSTVGSVNLVKGTGDITVRGINATGAVTIENGGEVKLVGGGAAESQGNVYAGGIVDIQAGTLTLNGKSVQGVSVSLEQTGAAGLELGGVTATGTGEAGTVDVSAAGEVSQKSGTAISASGATSVTVTDGSAVSLGNTGNEFGSVSVVGKTANTGAAGAVTIYDSTGNLALDAIRASQLTATTVGNLTQNAATTVSGAATLGAGNNKITLSQGLSGVGGNAAGKLTLNSNTDISSNIKVTEIDAGVNTLTQNGAGTITVTGANGITATTITQTSDAGTIEAGKFGGAVTQNGGTINGAVANGGVEITGVLDQNAGEIDLGTGKLTLGANASSAGDITAAEIDAGTHTFTQDGAGTIQVSGDNGIKAASIEQTANAGTIKAKKLDVGTTGTVTQNGGIINGAVANGDVEITGVLDQNAGEINLGTGKLTLRANASSAGDITAAEIDAGAHTFTQDGAGTIQVAGDNGIKAASIEQTANAGTIKAKKLDVGTTGTVTQNGGTINGAVADGGVEITGVLDQNAGTIDLGTGKLTLGANSTSGGTTAKPASITAGEIDAGTHAFTQDGAGTILVSGDNGIEATTITQAENAGTIKAKKLDGAVTQNGGTINGTGENGVGNVEITGVLDQNAGEINLGTGKLTLDANANAAGDITAGEIDAGTHTFTQDGAGTIRADSITASVVEQTYAGTASTAGAHATINADTINANFTQGDAVDSQKSGAYASASAKTAANGITITGKVVQNQFAANATIGAAGQNVTLQGGATQNGHGKVLAGTLTLAGNDNAYDLSSTEENAVSAIEGTAKSVAIHDGTTALELRVNVGTGDDHTVSVLKAGNVTLDGTTAKSITVTEAGDVEDTGAQADIATTVKLGTGGENKVASVTLDDTKNLTLDGVESTGAVTAKAETSLTLSGDINAADDADLALQGGTFTQNGKAVKGKNVTIDVTGTGATTINGDITAKDGDILVQSAGALAVSGTETDLDASNGSIIVKGKSVEVKEATLQAKIDDAEGIGLKSTGGATDGAIVVSDGAKFVAGTVVVDAGGNAEIGKVGDRVTMGRTAGTTDAELVVSAGSNVSGRFDSANRPTSEVSIYRAGKFDVAAGDVVELDSLALKTSDSIGNFTFKGSNLALESMNGSVEVTVTGGGTDGGGNEISSAPGVVKIFNNAPDNPVNASVSVANVVDSPASSVAVEVSLDDSVAAHGLVGKEVNLVVQNGKNVDLVVQAGAKIEATETGAALTLGSDGTSAGTLKSLTLEAGDDTTTDARISANGAVTVQTTGKMEIGGDIVSGADEVKLTAGKYVNVATTGSLAGKKDVSVTSTTGNVNFFGAAISEEGNVKISATTADAAGQTGKSVKIGNGTDAATIAATAGNVTLEGGRSVQILASSSVEAGGTLGIEADEYVVIAGAATANGNATVKTTDKQVLTENANSAAGIQVAEGGSLESTAGKVELVSAGSIAMAGNVSAKSTLDATANGEATANVQQGIQIAGGTISAEGKATLKAEKGGVKQTGGSLQSAGLEATALDVNQIGGAIVASGETTVKATGTAAGTGRIVLDQDGNNFENITPTAVASIAIRDANDLALHGASAAGGAALTGNVDVNAGGALTIDQAVNAGGNVSIVGAGALVVSQNVTAGAGGNVLLQSTGAGATVSSTVTAPGNLVIAGDGGAVTLAGATLAAQNVGIRGRSIPGLAAAQLPNAQTLALVSTAGNVELDGIPDSVANIGIAAAGGDIVLTAQGDRAFNGATVTAGGVTVRADGLAATGAGAGIDVTITDGNVTVGDVTAGGNATITATDGFVQAGNVTAGGAATIDAATAVTAGAIDANGGAATVTAGGAVTAASITGAQGTTVNAPGQAVTVAGQLGDGGDTAVTAGTLQSGLLASGGAATLTVAGDANVGQLAVGGDLNGATGAFTTTGGATGSIGQGGGLAVGGDMNIQGDLAAGGIAGTTVAGNLVVDGAVDAGDVDGLEIDGDMQLNADFAGDAVDITAANFVNGGGVLTAGQLTMAGNVGAAGNAFQVNSAQLQDVTGGQIYLVDTSAGPVALNVISATGGDAELQFNGEVNRMNAGSAGVSATGNIVLTTSSPFGDLDAPIPVTYGGTLTVNGVNAPLLHIVIGGTLNNQDPLSVIYGDAGGFAIWQTPAGGYQIVGTSPENRRLINRALAFTVNTPELKSKQGVFGDPAFVHTKMNVSEARSIGNMDVLALNDVDYRRTWSEIIGNTANFELDWKPAVFVSENPLNAKLKSVQAESETQPEIYRFQRRMAAPATAPAPVTAVR